MMTLIAEFKASAEFRALAPSSLRAYLNYIKQIEDTFGDMPLAVLDDRRVRGEFKAWRDRFANTPRLCLEHAGANSVVQQGSRFHQHQPLRRRRAPLLGQQNRQDLAGR